MIHEHRDRAVFVGVRAEAIRNADHLERLAGIAGARHSITGTEDRNHTVIRSHRHGVVVRAGAESGFPVAVARRDKDRGDCSRRITGLFGALHRDDVEASGAFASTFSTEIRAQWPGDFPVLLVAIPPLVVVISAVLVWIFDIRKFAVVIFLMVRLFAATAIRLVAGDRNNLTGKGAGTIVPAGDADGDWDESAVRRPELA